jgi:hypothetical protein
MSDNTTAAPPLRLFSTGIRFVAPEEPYLVSIFPLMVRAHDEQEALETAWGIFRDHTYDEQSGLYHLVGQPIFPFHVGVVDCSDFLNLFAESVRNRSKKPKKGEAQEPKHVRRKTDGNVIELFPGTGRPTKPAGKGKGPPRKPSPKKPKK